MILYENPNLKIELLDGQNVIVQHWDGYASSDRFREGIDKSIEIVRSKGISGIISDARTQSVVKPDDAAYAAESMPKLLSGGLKAIAFVVPESVFTQMSLEKFKKDSDGNDGTRYFAKFEEAKKWVIAKAK